MKKYFFIIIMCSILILIITGCDKSKNPVNVDELNKVNAEIIKFFSNNGINVYDNYIFNYIDEENNVVVVGLLNNNKEEQEQFKKLVINSDLIKFVKGEKLENSNENKNNENLKTFIRTYNILNIANSNDENYIYLTIRQFQAEEVQTIKVEKKLCPQIEEGKNYEFTIKPNKKLEDNILSIFANSTIISIKETDKIGLNQIQDSI